jgi:hypothetical protein
MIKSIPPEERPKGNAFTEFYDEERISKQE